VTGGQKIGVGFLVGGIVAAIGGGIALAFSGRSGALGGSVQMMRARGAAGFKPVYTKGSRAGLLREYRRDDFSTPDRIRLIDERIAVGMRDPAMRKLALAVTNHCEARDDACELQAVYDYVKTNVRYTGDAGAYVHYDAKGNPVYEQADVFQSPQRTLEYRGGDCLPFGTLLLVEDRGLLPIDRVETGMRIWGLDSWTLVEDIWDKGLLSLDRVVLADGSGTFLATREHKVFLADDRRVTVGELDGGMRLRRPAHLPIAAVTSRSNDVAVDLYPVIRRVERDVLVAPCRDLTTTDHRVYLPDCDVTVSQCDDHQGVVGTLLAWNGFDIRKKVTAPTASAPDAHIYIEAKRRVDWTALDTTLPYASGPGTEHPYGRASVWPGPNGVAPKASPALSARLTRQP